MNTARTTISMNSGTLNRLRLFSKKKKQSVSQIIEEAVKEKLKEQETKKVDNIYKEVETLQKSFKDLPENPDYKDKSVDEILYGSKGVWSSNNQVKND